MLYTVSSELYEEFEQAMESIHASLKKDTEKLADYIHCIRHYSKLLEDFVSAQGFKDDTEEIYFYKYIYPRFYSWNIYHVELHHILRVVPQGTDVMIRDYYIQELGYLHRSFNQSRYTYEYFLADDDIKDGHFFLHRNYIPHLPVSVISGANPDFLTNEGYTFAKFIAYERMQQFIVRRLKLLYQNPDNAFLAGLLNGKKRQWDGDKVELIEIAYGIYYTRRMNGGKADVSDIIEWLEDSLQVDLSQAYRMFLDIRRRKTISYTKFLEEMIKAIQDHINETNRFKPKKGKPLKTHEQQ